VDNEGVTRRISREQWGDAEPRRLGEREGERGGWERGAWSAWGVDIPDTGVDGGLQREGAAGVGEVRGRRRVR
jgi:hypothetical protein